MMSAAKQFRERYGISQPDLAVYLSVSLSLLKQSEINARSLPTPALLKLGNIALYEVKEGAENGTFFKASPAAKHHKKMNSAIQKAGLQLYVAKQQLEKVQKKYGQAQKLLALCTYLLAQNPTDDIEKLWLETQQMTARQKMKQHGKEEQTLLQWKIACLEFAITKGAEIMDSIEYSINDQP